MPSDDGVAGRLRGGDRLRTGEVELCPLQQQAVHLLHGGLGGTRLAGGVLSALIPDAGWGLKLTLAAERRGP